MQHLLEKLRHNLARSGVLEGVEPWVEVNVGQDGIPRGAVRMPLYPADADKLVRAASKARDLPPGAQIVFSFESDDGGEGREYVVVTTDPVTLIDRAVNLLTGFCTDVAEVRPGYAKCFVDTAGLV